MWASPRPCHLAAGTMPQLVGVLASDGSHLPLSQAQRPQLCESLLPERPCPAPGRTDGTAGTPLTAWHWGTKGWPLLGGDKFCGTVVAQSVPCGGWLKRGYSSPSLSFSPLSGILLSQLSFSREHLLNKTLPQESWLRLCFSESRPKTVQLNKMRLPYVISTIPSLSLSSLPDNMHIFHIFFFFLIKIFPQRKIWQLQPHTHLWHTRFKGLSTGSAAF